MTEGPSANSPARPAEIIFEVKEAVEGGYDARALGYSIYTQGENWDDLKEMARDAVLCHFEVVLSEDTDPEYTFDYLDIGAVETGRLTGKPERIRFGSSPSRARRVIRSGDTIVSTVRTYLKAVWHAEYRSDLIASTGFAVLTPRRSSAVPKFVSYLCQSDPFTNRVTAESVGIAYPAIAETRLGTFDVCVPPLSEQAGIVRFLNHADRRIRRDIRAKEKLIALLEEQKHALIHEAVTGQIDVRKGRPYSAYKGSGVEWLREVPEHWEDVSLGAAAESIQTGPFGSQLHARDYVSGEIPVINPSHLIRRKIRPDLSVTIRRRKAMELGGCETAGPGSA